MQIIVTQNWEEAHWAEHALALTARQQRQVEAHRLANPEATDDDILALLGIDAYDVINNGEVIDDGFEANDDDIESIEIQ